MEVLIIIVVVLFLAVLWNHSKARYWKRRSKELYKTALKEQHELQAEIEVLRTGR